MTSGQMVVLALLALCVAAGAATGNSLYYRLALVWAFVYFGGWLWSAFSLRGLQVRRITRTLRAQVGQIFEERFEIQNSSVLPRLWIAVYDQSPLPDSDGSRLLTLIEGKQGRAYLARTRLSRRGVFPLGPTALSSGDVFGLFPTRRLFPAEDQLLVYPMMIEVHSFPNPPGLLPGGEALRRRTHQITPNAAGVREYLPGDPLNRIHWLSTARRNRLMAKEFELDPLADVWIFVDSAEDVQAALPTPPATAPVMGFWERMVRFELPPSTEEYGVCITASLARAYLRRGRAVGLVCAGRHLTLLPPDRGGRQLGKILEALALLQAKGNLPLRGLVEVQVKHMVRGSTVVLVTPSVNPDLTLTVDYLLQRGLKPVAVLLEAETFGGKPGTRELGDGLCALGVPVCIIPNGADLEVALCNSQNR